MWNDPPPLSSSNPSFPPPPHSHGLPRLSKSAPCSPLKPLLSKRPSAPSRAESFHVIHKVPVGDTPYVKAKHVQLVDKDPNRAIALFWAAINAGDRVDSALKDMAIVMKQQNRPEEAIEAIKSLRHRCSDHAQESLDNVLLDLYKRCGRLDDQIALLKHKLHLIHQGLAFNGRRTKTARSQGKKFQVSIEQEATRLLGNLGWAYMQQANFVAAEAVYRKALSIEPDNNKVCNLGICLMKQGRLKEAKVMLKSVKPACGDGPWGSDSHLKSYERAQQMLKEMEGEAGGGEGDETSAQICGEEEDHQRHSASSAAAAASGPPLKLWCSQNPHTDSDLSGALFATAGFGPVSRPPLPPQQLGGGEPAAAAQQSLSSFAMALDKKNKWEEEDAERGFADENTTDSSRKADERVNWHAEVLRLRLEKMAVGGGKKPAEALRNGGSQHRRSNSAGNLAATPFAPSSVSVMQALGEISNGSLLNSAALPFVAKSVPASAPAASNDTFHRELSDRRMMKTAELGNNSNSLKPLSFDTANCPKEAVANRRQQQQNSVAAPVSVQAQPQMSPARSNRAKSAAISAAAMARPSQLVVPERGTPETKKNCCRSLNYGGAAEGDSSSPDAWSKLGFIQGDSSSPLCSIATIMRRRNNAITTAMSPLMMLKAEEEECQRRLQVFVEMTLPASPQA